MSSEAKDQKDPVTKQQVQSLTDLASFNAFCMVKLPKGGTVSTQLTYRHGMPEDAYIEDFQKWYRILSRLEADGGNEPYVEFWNGAKSPVAPAAVSQPDKPSNGNGSTGGDKPKRNYKDPLPASEVPEELADTNEDVYAAEFDLFKILPQPDDKATVEFWKDGLDFPVGAKMNKWKHDTIRQALSRLTEDAIDPSKAAEYRIAGTQFWVKGNEFTITQGAKKGEKSHYKNLVLVKPAF